MLELLAWCAAIVFPSLLIVAAIFHTPWDDNDGGDFDALRFA